MFDSTRARLPLVGKLCIAACALLATGLYGFRLGVEYERVGWSLRTQLPGGQLARVNADGTVGLPVGCGQKVASEPTEPLPLEIVLEVPLAPIPNPEFSSVSAPIRPAVQVVEVVNGEDQLDDSEPPEPLLVEVQIETPSPEFWEFYSCLRPGWDPGCPVHGVKACVRALRALRGLPPDSEGGTFTRPWTCDSCGGTLK